MEFKGTSSKLAKMSAGNLNSNKQENSLPNMYQTWKLPKISVRDVYRRGIFEFNPDYSIETKEQTVLLSKNLATFELLSGKAISKHRQEYNYLHIGLVQVGITPLTSAGRKASVVAALRDCRLLRFSDSLLGIIESSLCNGPVFFNCYPNYCVSLSDHHILRTLTLNMKATGCQMQLENSLTLAITWRMHYKVMKTTSKPNAIKGDPPGKTLLLQTDVDKGNTIVPRIINWDEIEAPSEWSLNEASAHEMASEFLGTLPYLKMFFKV